MMVEPLTKKDVIKDKKFDHSYNPSKIIEIETVEVGRVIAQIEMCEADMWDASLNQKTMEACMKIIKRRFGGLK